MQTDPSIWTISSEGTILALEAPQKHVQDLHK